MGELRLEIINGGEYGILCATEKEYLPQELRAAPYSEICTVYYQKERDALVLNKGHRYYEQFRDILVEFVQLPDMEKFEVLKIARKQGITILDFAIRIMRIQRKRRKIRRMKAMKWNSDTRFINR